MLAIVQLAISLTMYIRNAQYAIRRVSNAMVRAKLIAFDAKMIFYKSTNTNVLANVRMAFFKVNTLSINGEKIIIIRRL